MFKPRSSNNGVSVLYPVMQR